MWYYDGNCTPQSRQSAKLFSSRRNRDSPNPSPAGGCAPSPFGSGGEGHTRLRVRWSLCHINRFTVAPQYNTLSPLPTVVSWLLLRYTYRFFISIYFTLNLFLRFLLVSNSFIKKITVGSPLKLNKFVRRSLKCVFFDFFLRYLPIPFTSKPFAFCSPLLHS